jgi:hypothetical protein
MGYSPAGVVLIEDAEKKETLLEHDDIEIEWEDD